MNEADSRVLFKLTSQQVEDLQWDTYFSGKRFLICGAGGLLGVAIVELLLSTNLYSDPPVTVYAMGRNRIDLEERFSQYSEDPNFKILEGDVVSFDLSGHQFDCIIHAASPAHPLAYSQSPVDVMKANLLGTIRLLDLAREAKAKFLFISSGEIYGTNTETDGSFNEEDYGYIDILAPRACYPESKRAAETLCVSYALQYGVDARVARLCHVYGPTITEKNSRADAQFLRKAVRGENIVMKSTGEQIRSFCYVKDAAIGLLYILAKGKSGEAYNVADKNSIVSIRKYAEILAELGHVQIVNEFPPESEKNGYSRVTRAVLNAGKLESLGWWPQYSLREGLSETLELYRKLEC